MNDPEVTMNNKPQKSNLIATENAIQAAADAIKLVKQVPAPLNPIANQVIRSASSVPANLAEGHGRFGRDRAHHWRIAYASAREVDSHLRILCLSRSDVKLDTSGQDIGFQVAQQLQIINQEANRQNEMTHAHNRHENDE